MHVNNNRHMFQSRIVSMNGHSPANYPTPPDPLTIEWLAPIYPTSGNMWQLKEHRPIAHTNH